jgi:hypothetical protein
MGADTPIPPIRISAAVPKGEVEESLRILLQSILADAMIDSPRRHQLPYALISNPVICPAVLEEPDGSSQFHGQRCL